MKFVIAQKGSPSIKICKTWTTDRFNEENFGLFLDSNCVCFLTKDQAKFLEILKMDEDKISSIEITNDKITIQPKAAESMDYERPTGDIQFKEHIMKESTDFKDFKKKIVYQILKDPNYIDDCIASVSEVTGISNDNDVLELIDEWLSDESLTESI